MRHWRRQRTEPPSPGSDQPLQRHEGVLGPLNHGRECVGRRSDIGDGRSALNGVARKPAQRCPLEALRLCFANGHADRQGVAEVDARQLGCGGSDEIEVPGGKGALKSRLRRAGVTDTNRCRTPSGA